MKWNKRIYWLVVIILLVSISTMVHGTEYIENSQATFVGTFTNTFYNTTTNSVQPNISILNFIDTTSLSGWWNMEDGANAVNGYGEDLTNSGVAFIKSPRLGRYSGDVERSSTDYLNGSTKFLDFERTDAFTISAWIKPESLGNYQYFVTKQTDAGDFTGYGFLLFNDNKLTLQIRNDFSPSNQIQSKTTATIPTHEWTHVVATYDGSSSANGVELYINGVNQSQNTPINTLSASIKNTAKFTISSRDGGSNGFDGMIDEVMIWNRELSNAEVAEIYKVKPPFKELLNYSSTLIANGISNNLTVFQKSSLELNPSETNEFFSDNIDYSNLIAYYPLNENGNDLSGNSLNLENFSNVVNTSGVFNQSMNFTNGNGYIQGQTSGTALPQTTGSFSVWVYPTGDSSNDFESIVTLDDGTTSNRVALRTETEEALGLNIISGNVFTSEYNILNRNEWNFIVANWNTSSDKYEIWLNGQNLSGTTAAIGNPSGMDHIRIGATTTALANYGFVGNIDELGIWDKTLSETEIIALFNRGNKINKSNLINGTKNIECDYGINLCIFNEEFSNITFNQYYESYSSYFFPELYNFTLDYIDLGGDTLAPSVVTNYPTGAISTQNVTFNCTISDDTDIVNVSLYNNYGGTWHLNTTNSSGVNSVNYLFASNITESGTYTWGCEACDSATNCNQTNSSFTLSYPPFDNFTITDYGMEWIQLYWI